MKIRILKQTKTRGNVLLVTLITCLVIGVTLASYLVLVSSQNRSVMRSLAWNSAVPILEAGVEEALSQLHYTGVTNLSQNGWLYTSSPEGPVYAKTRFVGDARFEVWIRPVDPPVIISTAFVPAPLTPSGPLGMLLGSLVYLEPGQAQHIIVRRVRVPTRKDALFAKGMQAKGYIDLNGNNIMTDSFDSTNPAKSGPGGKYDPAKNNDKGDVATNLDVIDSIDLGNADIMGHVSTGPGGTIHVGSNGSAGSKAWVTGGHTGVEPGWSTDDMNVQFPDVAAPFTSGYLTPGSGNVGGTNYAYVLGEGNYYLNTVGMSGKNGMLVNGNATLYVPGNFGMSGKAYILIAPGKTFKLYVGGASADLSGNGVINSGGLAINFQYFGLPSNTSLSMSGNGEMVGVVYAPHAALSLNGGGSGDNDFIGASVTKSVTMNGHFKFHYDESLANLGPEKDYIPTSWIEIPFEVADMIWY